MDSPPGLRTRDRSLPGSGTTAPQRGDANVPIRRQNAILINLEKALKSGIFRRWKFLAFWPVQHILDHEQQIRTKQRIRPRWALTFCTDLIRTGAFRAILRWYLVQAIDDDHVNRNIAHLFQPQSELFLKRRKNSWQPVSRRIARGGAGASTW